MTSTKPADLDRADSADRVDEPLTRRLRPSRRVIIPAVIVLLVAATLWVVVFSPLLGARNIAVRGARGAVAAQVISAAGIAHGTPLVRLDTGSIARRVEQIPVVRTAEVSTSFPSTVTITVVERRAVGWVRASGHDELVDSTGMRYRTVAKRPAHLPLLVLPADSGAATTAAVAAVAAALPARMLPRITSVQALDQQAITLVLRGDRVVHWGSAAQSVAKARVLPVLLHQVHRHGGTQIDVSDPSQPFVR
jgi:cell division protein FtsQ